MKEVCKSENKINPYPIIKDFIGDEETNKLIEEITHKTLVEYYIEKYNLDYIHKDKIKELIKEKAKTDTYNFKTIAVKDLEKLLGETNE